MTVVVTTSIVTEALIKIWNVNENFQKECTYTPVQENPLPVYPVLQEQL